MSFSKSPDNKMPQIFDFLLIKYLLKDVHTVPAYFKGFFFQKKRYKNLHSGRNIINKEIFILLL